MARVRLIALVAVGCGLGGCARSEAAPEAPAATSGLATPRGWQASPALAKVAADAATSKIVRVAGSEAWAEPARGCYALWLSLTGNAGDVVAAGDELVAALAKAGVTARDVVKPAAGEHATMSFAFDRAPYHGTLRAQLASSGAITALACAWNAREPAACAAACTALLGGLK
jgi:hypothetical protein